MKVIGAGFPKTGTKSLWHAMDILGYNHAESPVWVDHIDQIDQKEILNLTSLLKN